MIKAGDKRLPTDPSMLACQKDSFWLAGTGGMRLRLLRHLACKGRWNSIELHGQLLQVALRGANDKQHIRGHMVGCARVQDGIAIRSAACTLCDSQAGGRGRSSFAWLANRLHL